MIDFHCHLDLYRYPSLAVEDADKAGIHVLFVTTLPKAWPEAQKMIVGCPNIRVALGLHPEIAHERESELSLFEKYGNQTKYFGEIGLDGSPQLRNFQDVQARVFHTVLRLAAEMGGKILSIHSRRATEQVLDSLASHSDFGVPVLHWFSGSQRQLRRAIEQGCWFSCGPAMLRSAKGKAIAKMIPRERMLTETDGPFAFVESRPLQPADSWSAVESLSNIWDVDLQESVSILLHNLKDLTAKVQLHAPAANVRSEKIFG